jgi:hypothetical protein
VPFAYYDRLTPRRRRVYDASDRIHAVPLADAEALKPLVAAIEDGLAREDARAAGVACQRLIDALGERLELPQIRVKVYRVRPQLADGELHGLYEPANDPGEVATISVWMRTAQKKQVVKFRTFLRTLLHELCHHLDYEYFHFPETFHTEGFYKRESHLLKQLAGDAAGAASPPAAA